MPDEMNKSKGLRATMRDRVDEQETLDQFTVLQDVGSEDLSAKSYDIDTIISEDDVFAANPLMGIKNQDILDDADLDGASFKEKKINATDSETDTGADKDSINSFLSDIGVPEVLSSVQSDRALPSDNTPQESSLRLQVEDSDIEAQNVYGAPLLNETPENVSIVQNAATINSIDIDNSVFPISDDEDIEDDSNIDDASNDDETVEVETVDDTTVDDAIDDEDVTDTSDDALNDMVDDNGDTETQNLSPNLNIRVSHATNNQDTINSIDGYDLVPENYGVPQTVNGTVMDIAGVKSNAQITYIFHDENTAEVTLDTAWNSVKNIEVNSDFNGNVKLNNFVQTDVNFGEGGDSTVIINGAKRGNVTTEGGNDVVEINAQTNNSGWGNNFDISTGDGNDVITVTGDKGHTGFNIDAGDNNDNVTIGGAYDASDVHLGKGSDTFIGGDGNDVVRGGSGSDIIDGGAGDDTLSGGVNPDTLIGGEGNDTLKGGSGGDKLYGGTGDDVLDGGSGDDFLDGGDGTDILIGGRGDDTLMGGIGDDTLTGGEGQDTYVITSGDGNVTITDFGGVGGGGSGEAALMPHHDTILLDGEGLTADNMLLNYDGQNTVITFEGVDAFSITLDSFDYTDLDNLPAVQGWNIIFDGQTEGTDAYDVFNNDGTSQNSLWGKNTVTHLNDVDNVVNGKNGSDDIINAMEGDDIVSGQTGHDVIRGQGGNDTLYGDDPSDTGSSYVTTTIDVNFISSNAGYKNSIGAYAIDKEGNILGVDIGIENAKAASSGDHFSIEVSGPEASGVGYFIISNGFSKNTQFFNQYDSTDGNYSFLYKAGTQGERPANIADDPADIALVFDTGNETIILNGDMYHSTASLNSDGNDHVLFETNTDGTTRLGFEDLKNLGDADFDDVVLDVSVANETLYELPQKEGGDDRLVGGEGDDRLIGQGGNDILEGGADNDTAVFSGFIEEYQISENENGSITVIDSIEGRDGIDTVYDIEFFEFNGIEYEVGTQNWLTAIADINDQDDPIGDSNDLHETVNEDVVVGNDNDNEDNEDNETNESDDASNDDETVEVETGNDGNNGHGNDADGVDNSNPGKGQGGPNAEHNGNSSTVDEYDNSAESGSDDEEESSIDGLEINGNNGKDTLVGGDGDDLIDGGNGKDNLTGGGGDDVIYGGNGKDTAHYSGDIADYKISENENGSYTISDTVEGRDGTDTVYDTEFFEFNDDVYAEGSQSWLSAIESSSDQIDVESGMGDEDQSWISEVAADVDNDHVDHNNSDADDGGGAIDLTNVIPNSANSPGEAAEAVL